MLCKRIVLLLLVPLFYSSSFADTNPQAETLKPTAPLYDKYYTITEKNASALFSVQKFSEFSPEMDLQRLATLAKSAMLNLLRWTLHDEIRPIPAENYIRKLHFGRWINDPMDETCMNTRAKVLVRDSDADVTYRNNKNCVVNTGLWTDNYSDQELAVAREVQIDHMVPLKHAYISGAWKWDYKTRCLYANYLGYRGHLVPASVYENTSKGDRGPEKYLPSNQAYRCQYVKDWLAIKLIWRLTLITEEIDAVQAVIEKNNCDVKSFTVTLQELKDQRTHINKSLEYCMINRR